jgi:hypothetical protein
VSDPARHHHDRMGLLENTTEYYTPEEIAEHQRPSPAR